MADDPALTAFVAWLNNASGQQAPKKPAAKKTVMKAGAEYTR
ncbi:hypothetical protein [Bradyrhizobium sp. sGM-13]|nr:hypothetical protein [Bradyrhizobium sp. sGM-13]